MVTMTQVDPKKDIMVASSGPQEVSCGSFERSFYSHLIRRLYMKRHFKKTVALIA